MFVALQWQKWPLFLMAINFDGRLLSRRHVKCVCEPISEILKNAYSTVCAPLIQDYKG